MKKLNSKGFGLLSILLIIVILAAVGGAGYYIYQKNQDSNEATAKSEESTQDATKPAKEATKTDPYAGWKTYNNTTYGYSFRYPSDWRITDDAKFPGITMNSPDNTVHVMFLLGEPDYPDSPFNFTTTSIQQLRNANQDLTVFGGYGRGTDQYFPGYHTISTSLVSDYSLKVGVKSPLPTSVFEFKNPGDTTYGSFDIVPVEAQATLDEANKWLDAVETKTALQMIQSLRYEK